MAGGTTVNDIQKRALGSRDEKISLILFFVFSIAVMIGVTQLRGVGLDEFWSLHFGDLKISFATALHDRWLRDTHPVFANALYYVSMRIGLENIHFLRLILNTPPLFILYFSSFSMWRANNKHPFFILFSVYITSLPYFMNSFSEFRSYFFQLCLIGIVIQFVFHVILRAENESPFKNLLITALGIVSIAFGISIHFLTGLIVSTVVGLFLAYLIYWRRKFWFLIIAIPAIFAWCVTLLFVSLQFPYIVNDFDYSWLKTTVIHSVFLFGIVAIKIFIANPVANFSSIYSFRNWNSTLHPNNENNFIVILALSLLISATLLLSIHYFKPVIDQRYLTIWSVILCGLITALSASHILKRKLYFFLFLTAAITSVMYNGYKSSKYLGWYEGQALIANIVHNCPDTRVFATSSWRGSGGRYSKVAKRESEILYSIYKRLSHEAGFSVTLLPLEGVVKLPRPEHCPIVLWADHHALTGDGPARLSYAEIAFDQSSGLEFVTTSSGTVVISRPVSAQNPKLDAKPPRTK